MQNSWRITAAYRPLKLVTVDTANRDGQILASQVRSSPAYESNAREISLDPVNKLIDDIVKANAG